MDLDALKACLVPALRVPGRPDLLQGDFDLNPHIPRAAPYMEAAVLIALLMRAGGVTVLFAKRPDSMRHHPSQYAFPGGKREAAESAEACALREAFEEVGLEAARVDILGRLPDYHTRTGFRITPVVAVVTAPPERFIPDPHEVAGLLEVPLAHILERPFVLCERVLRARQHFFYTLQYQGAEIWGATGGMLHNLRTLLLDARAA